MKNGIVDVLTRYHRDVMLPDVQRIVDDAINTSVGSLRNDMYSHFDAIYVRFDRLESEYYALRSWMSRLDERLVRVESELQSLNVRVGGVESELQGVKSGLRALEMRVADIENKINRLATDSELVEIRQQIVILNDRIAALETRH
jgi:predicted  nucleic acid-binding Zn-ribbon protein